METFKGKSLINNLNRIAEGRYNIEYIRFAISYLKSKHYDSYQKIICQLIESGLKCHPVYKESLVEIENAYKQSKI